MFKNYISRSEYVIQKFLVPSGIRTPDPRYPDQMSSAASHQAWTASAAILCSFIFCVFDIFELQANFSILHRTERVILYIIRVYNIKIYRTLEVMRMENGAIDVKSSYYKIILDISYEVWEYTALAINTRTPSIGQFKWLLQYIIPHSMPSIIISYNKTHRFNNLS